MGKCQYRGRSGIIPVRRRSGIRLTPSRIFPEGASAPTASVKVGKKSISFQRRSGRGILRLSNRRHRPPLKGSRMLITYNSPLDCQSSESSLCRGSSDRSGYASINPYILSGDVAGSGRYQECSGLGDLFDSPSTFHWYCGQYRIADFL